MAERKVNMDEEQIADVNDDEVTALEDDEDFDDDDADDEDEDEDETADEM